MHHQSAATTPSTFFWLIGSFLVLFLSQSKYSD
jgi:hypothetical protein